MDSCHVPDPEFMHTTSRKGTGLRSFSHFNMMKQQYHPRLMIKYSPCVWYGKWMLLIIIVILTELHSASSFLFVFHH